MENRSLEQIINDPHSAWDDIRNALKKEGRAVTNFGLVRTIAMGTPVSVPTFHESDEDQSKKKERHPLNENSGRQADISDNDALSTSRDESSPCQRPKTRRRGRRSIKAHASSQISSTASSFSMAASINILDFGIDPNSGFDSSKGSLSNGLQDASSGEFEVDSQGFLDWVHDEEENESSSGEENEFHACQIIMRGNKLNVDSQGFLGWCHDEEGSIDEKSEVCACQTVTKKKKLDYSEKTEITVETLEESMKQLTTDSPREPAEGAVNGAENAANEDADETLDESAKNLLENILQSMEKEEVQELQDDVKQRQSSWPRRASFLQSLKTEEAQKLHDGVKQRQPSWPRRTSSTQSSFEDEVNSRQYSWPCKIPSSQSSTDSTSRRHSAPARKRESWKKMIEPVKHLWGGNQGPRRVSIYGPSTDGSAAEEEIKTHDVKRALLNIRAKPITAEGNGESVDISLSDRSTIGNDSSDRSASGSTLWGMSKLAPLPNCNRRRSSRAKVPTNDGISKDRTVFQIKNSQVATLRMISADLLLAD